MSVYKRMSELAPQGWVVLMDEDYQRGADLLNCPAYCAHKQRTYIGDELYFCTVAPKGSCPREQHSLMDAVIQSLSPKWVDPETASALEALNTYRRERGLL